MLNPETIQMIYQLTLAAFLGMLVGFEREYRGKPAGLRTYMLVAVGAALFTIMSVESSLGAPYFDPSRIASAISRIFSSPSGSFLTKLLKIFPDLNLKLAA